ncbi:MAG: bifunctional oligoribonuclease/PAP phosphatase NrnA [Candidatus Aminicenantes bacterium]|nr:bifunctional oligoribonuclease/PAP phosphatase NrnA [Candidatus Aminicenantes bacterium]
MTRSPIDPIVEALKSARRLAITSHLRPDGDSLCTSLALALAAEQMGKQVEIVNADRTPYPFSTFPSCARIRVGQIPARGQDVVVLLECADVSRSGMTEIEGDFKINIDHHYSNDLYADLNWVDAEASAVGEMMAELCRRLPVALTPEMAGHLYCAIASDTGSFQFSNTTARAFATCHELVLAGADPLKVSESLYHNNTPEKIQLLGRVLSTLTIAGDGDIAVISMRRQTLRELGLSEVDTEDITTLARSIRDVNVVLFFKEVGEETFRVSIRSRGIAHAAAIAERFQGGGHAHAAGFTVYGPHDRLIVEVPAQVAAIIRELAARPTTTAP